MAKKTKRRPTAKQTQPARPAPPSELSQASAAAELHVPEAPPPPSRQPEPVLAPRRAVNAAKLPSTAAALIEGLPPEDASIPLDRVPYVTGDLLRVAVMAVIMVLLIIVGGIITVHYTSSLS